jgi:hypothetical protein
LKVDVLVGFVIGFVSLGLATGAESTVPPGSAIVEQYCAATQGQNRLMQASSMDVEIAASIPKLNKKGKLKAQRRVSARGQISYEKLRFEGDGTVKKQIINRYLGAEAEVQADPSLRIPVTPENYNFKYKGEIRLDGRDTHVFEVSPKRKRQGVFRGELWVDAATFLRVLESGYMVKSPSPLLKKVAFVRKYQIRDGISVPRQEQSYVDTRLGIGRAELTIDFSNFAIDSAVNGADGIQ